MLQQAEGQYTAFDKLAYHNALQNSKGSFSVNHLLDLGEIPSENCAMFANTDPSPGLPTQTCTPDSPNGGLQTDGHTQALVNEMDMMGQQQKVQQDQCLKEEPQDVRHDQHSGMQCLSNSCKHVLLITVNKGIPNTGFLKNGYAKLV